MDAAGLMGYATVFKNRTEIPDLDCNKATDPGAYYYYNEQGALKNSPGLARFVLLTFVSWAFMVQVAFSYSTSESGGYSVKFRSYNGAAWLAWASL